MYKRQLEEGTTKCAQTTEYQGHGPARGQESRVVSALCTTSKPYVLVRRVSDDKATSRVPPGTPRDEEIRGWSLQARLRAREGGLKSLEVLWVLEVDSDRRRRPRGPANRWIWSADLANSLVESTVPRNRLTANWCHWYRITKRHSLIKLDLNWLLPLLVWP